MLLFLSFLSFIFFLFFFYLFIYLLSTSQGDDEEGVIAQFSSFGTAEGEEERKKEREKMIQMLPEGAKLLTDLNLDVTL